MSGGGGSQIERTRPESPAARRSRPGCWLIGAYILFPPLWLAHRVAPAGWRTANRVFSPRHATVPANRRLEIVQTARTISGTIVVGGVYVYADQDKGLGAFQQDLAVRTGLAVVIGFGAITVGLTVLLIATRPPFRREVVSRLRHPALAVAVAAGMAGFLALTTYVDFPTIHTSGLIAALLLLLALAVSVVFSVIFWVRSMFLIGKNLFNTADVHPMLPCLLSPLVAWVLTGIELTQPSVIPSPTRYVVALSGATIVMILSVVEWRYLRGLGLSIRTGPRPGSR